MFFYQKSIIFGRDIGRKKWGQRLLFKSCRLKGTVIKDELDIFVYLKRKLK